MATRIINPVLQGFYPDASICCKKERFYLTAASYTLFPALPLFKSKDGVKWKQIGNILNQSNYKDISETGPIKAPVIRFSEGVFYCIFSNADSSRIFITSAIESESNWSAPIEIKTEQNFYPSLFFDENETCWYCAVKKSPENQDSEDFISEIFVQKFNTDTFKFTGEAKTILKFSSQIVESPHIYKIDGKYFLLYSKGQNILEKEVWLAVSDKLTDGWKSGTEPFFTHSHLGANAKITGTCGAEFFCNNDKFWWMTCNATRPLNTKKKFCTMGNETFMVPVKWENGMPVPSFETKIIEQAFSFTGHVVKRNNEDADSVEFPVIDDFNTNELDNFWISLKSRNPEYINCSENIGNLRMYGGAPLSNINSNNTISFVGRRQTAFSFEASTRLECYFSSVGDKAGICCFQSEAYNYMLQIINKGMVISLQLIKTENGKETLLAEEIMTGGTSHCTLTIRVVCEKQNLRFEYGVDERNMFLFADNISTNVLSSENTQYESGTIIGMFAISGGDYTKKDFYVDFDWFKYQNTAKLWTD